MSAKSAPKPPPANYAERMIPYETDFATEMTHWQRYLFFRPWYEGKKIVDAACGEGYGVDYASTFAEEAIGYDISQETISNANARYPATRFACADVRDVDYSDADVVLSFSTISCLKDPDSFFAALASCPGTIVVSAPNREVFSPGNALADAPLNPYHVREWTPKEFAELIGNHFPDRQIRILSQEQRWPAIIREGLDETAAHCIAVIGDLPIPEWPRLGISMPTMNNASGACDAIIGFSRFYPGEIEFAVVTNGTDERNLGVLKNLEGQVPHMITILQEPTNIGYGGGANRGLAYLSEKGDFDYYIVTNDDVVPATDCVNEMVWASKELEAMGHKPGVVGPVSNNVNGAQQVDIGAYANLAEMLEVSRVYHRRHVDSASQVVQVRGLCLLIHPDCLAAVGGFDPCFGLGNFEDDDHNLRTRLAGFTLWVAEGAYLFHAGSTTFKQLNINYEASIQRNAEVLARKWGLADFTQWVGLQEKPDDVDLFVPFSAGRADSGKFVININGQPVDLMQEASDIEFAAWVMNALRERPREDRRAVIQVLDERRCA